MIGELSNYIDKDSFTENVFQMIPKHEHIIIDMFVSNVCNLKCKHCYFLEYKPGGTPLNLQNWYDIINDCVCVGIKHFHFSGKEPFCDQRVPLLLEKLNEMSPKSDLKYGVVTNGTRLTTKYLKELIDTNIAYLEFSLEGDKLFNKDVRGVNSYDNTFGLLNDVPDKSKLNITSTYFGNNLQDLEKMIDAFSKIGVSKFNIAPFQKFSSNALQPVKEIDYSLMLDLISAFREFISNVQENSVDIRICVTRRQAYNMFHCKNVLTEDINNFIYKGDPLIFKTNNNILEVSFPLLFIPFLSQLIVTTDGLVIPCADDIHFKELNKISLGNMKCDTIDTIIKKRSRFISTYINQKIVQNEKN